MTLMPRTPTTADTNTQWETLWPLAQTLYEELSHPIPDRAVVGRALHALLLSTPSQAGAITATITDWLQRFEAGQDFEQEAMDALKGQLQQHMHTHAHHGYAHVLHPFMGASEDASQRRPSF